jgi:hypothetical protein
MIPPGKTTLSRMQVTAHNEAQRIEISQDGYVKLGWTTTPLPDQVRLRDDFAGIVRLIDIIESDKVILGRIEDALKRPAAARAARAADRPDTELVPIGEEIDDQ